jgi:hypothetical protein
MIRPETKKKIVDQDMTDLASVFVRQPDVRNQERIACQLLRSIQ